MCGPKQSRLNPAVGAGRSFPSQASSPDTLKPEKIGLEPLGPDAPRPFNSFTAPVSLVDNARTSGLRFPLSPKKEDLDDGFIPTLDPATGDRQASNLGSVYNFGEGTVNEKFGDKIRRDIHKNHRIMSENNNRHRANLEETFLDETRGSFDLKKSIKNLQDKYGGHDPDDPEAIGYEYKSAQLHNQKVRRDFIKEQHAQRERQGNHPSAYSEEGLSVEELQGPNLTASEKAEEERKSRAFWEKIQSLATEDSITEQPNVGDYEHIKTLKKTAHDNWFKLNKAAEKRIVPVIKESTRQAAQILEDSLNTVIKAKNAFLFRETKDGDLIIIDKPEVSNDPLARFVGAVVTIGLPGGVGKLALSGSKTVQAMKAQRGFKGKIAKFGEGVTGSLLTSNEKDPLLAYAFKNHPEIQHAIQQYHDGEKPVDFVRAKLLRAGVENLGGKTGLLFFRYLKLKQKTIQNN